MSVFFSFHFLRREIKLATVGLLELRALRWRRLQEAKRDGGRGFETAALEEKFVAALLCHSVTDVR